MFFIVGQIIFQEEMAEFIMVENSEQVCTMINSNTKDIIQLLTHLFRLYNSFTFFSGERLEALNNYLSIIALTICLLQYILVCNKS